MPDELEIMRKAIAIAFRVRDVADGPVSGRHSIEILIAAAAVQLALAEGRYEPRTYYVLKTADAIAEEFRAEGSVPESVPDFDVVEARDGARHWAIARELLEQNAPRTSFELWIDPIRPLGIRDGVLWLGAPERVRSWIERRYRQPIEAAVTRVCEDVGCDTILVQLARLEP